LGESDSAPRLAQSRIGTIAMSPKRWPDLSGMMPAAIEKVSGPTGATRYMVSVPESAHWGTAGPCADRLVRTSKEVWTRGRSQAWQSTSAGLADGGPARPVVPLDSDSGRAPADRLRSTGRISHQRALGGGVDVSVIIRLRALAKDAALAAFASAKPGRAASADSSNPLSAGSGELAGAVYMPGLWSERSAVNRRRDCSS
jgi:hypothetical protein